MNDVSDHPLRDTLPFNEAVGRNARRLRMQHGITLDRMATAASVLGLKWTTARVIEFEKGKIPPSLPTMMMVAQALGTLAGTRIRLEELVEFDGWLLAPSANTALRAEVYQRALRGEPVNFTDDVSFEQEQRDRDAATEAASVMPEVPRGVSVKWLKYMHEYAGIADERAAKKLGMSLDEFLGFCWLTLRQTITEYGYSQLGPHVSPQKRGRLTRELIARIEKAAADYREAQGG